MSKATGPRVAIINNWYAANMPTFLSRAFEEAGWTVERWGTIHPGHYGIEWGPEEAAILSTVNLLPQGGPVDLAKFDADMILLCDWPELQVRNPAERSCPLALYEPEGWSWCWKRREELRPDAAFTPMPWGVLPSPYDAADPSRSALQDGWRYLPGAWLESAHPAMPEKSDPKHVRDIDFVSYAIPYNFRPRLCARLAAEGFRVECGQRDLAGYVAGHHRALATCDSHEGQEYIKWRLFEAAGMGTVILWTRCKLLDMLGFVPGVHYMAIEPAAAPGATDGHIEPNFDVTTLTLGYLRRHPELAATLRRNAFDLVSSRHTYAHRVWEIVSHAAPALLSSLPAIRTA